MKMEIFGRGEGLPYHLAQWGLSMGPQGGLRRWWHDHGGKGVAGPTRLEPRRVRSRGQMHRRSDIISLHFMAFHGISWHIMF